MTWYPGNLVYVFEYRLSNWDTYLKLLWRFTQLRGIWYLRLWFYPVQQNCLECLLKHMDGLVVCGHWQVLVDTSVSNLVLSDIT